MRKSIVILLLCIGMFSSCEELANQSLPTDVVFFDLKKFIGQEVVRLDKLNPTIEKITSVNGTKETKTIQLSDSDNEFKIFKEADINKLAWIDKYAADTSFVNNQVSTIHYKAIDEKLTTRDLKVSFSQDQVSKIELFTHATSIVTDVEKHMVYEPNIRYSILSKQKTTGSDANEIEIVGTFVK